VTWHVTRLDTNQTVLGTDVPAAEPGALTASIDHSSPTYAAVPRFYLTCVLYRALGYTTQQIVEYRVEIDIEDWVDRSKRFIAWDHTVWFLPPAGDPSSKYWERTRKSRIHRTDVPYRCLLMRRQPWQKG
jgi:hypothetical protein